MNISTVSQRDFVQLGQSMKYYIYACIIAAVGAIIAVASIFGSVFSTATFYYSLPSINPIALIIGLVIVVIVLAILVLVFYIKMILNIGVVGRSTNDAHLLKAYNCFKWSILANFLGGALFAGIITVVINSIYANPVADVLYGFGLAEMLIGLIIGGGVVFFIIVCILPIIGAIALHDWVIEYTTGKQSNACKSIKDGSDLLKLGYILSLIPGISFIGSILAIVGLWQCGSGLITEFSGEPTPATPILGTQVPIPQGGNPVQAGFVAPAPFSTMEVSPAMQVQFCPHCGKQVETSSARFCQSCGMPLY